MWARLINGLLGIWLFVSAFVWPHTTFHRWVAIVVGVLFVFDAVLAVFDEGGRFLNGLFAVYLVLVAVTVHKQSMATLWNALIVGAVVFTVAFLGNSRRPSAA